MNNKICVIGLGYVGLPLAIALSKKFKVIGYDKSNKKNKKSFPKVKMKTTSQAEKN